MTKVTMDELAWIHDCLLLRVVYESTAEEETQVLLHLRCPKDLGVAAWNGNDIVLAARDVAMFRHIAWPGSGEESVLAVRPGISKEADDSTLGARRAGVRFPSCVFTVEFAGGSYMEVICDSVAISLDERERT